MYIIAQCVFFFKSFLRAYYKIIILQIYFEFKLSIGVISSIILADTGTVVHDAEVQPLLFASSSITSIVYFGFSIGNIDTKKVRIILSLYFPLTSFCEVPVFPPAFIFLRFARCPVHQ